MKRRKYKRNQTQRMYVTGAHERKTLRFIFLAKHDQSEFLPNSLSASRPVQIHSHCYNGFEHFTNSIARGNVWKYFRETRYINILVIDKENYAEDPEVAQIISGAPNVFTVMIDSQNSPVTAKQNLKFTRLGVNAFVAEIYHLVNSDIFLESFSFRPNELKADRYSCPICSLEGFTESQLQLHVPMYHANAPNSLLGCPICPRTVLQNDRFFQRAGLNLHIQMMHGLASRRDKPRHPAQLVAFVLITRLKNGIRQYLLTKEPAGLSRSRMTNFFWAAGAVDNGETFEEAAMRESLEEAGVRVKLTGLVKLWSNGTIFHFLGETEDEAKRLPDFESLGAVWMTSDEIKKIQDSYFRDWNMGRLINQIDNGSQPIALYKNMSQQQLTGLKELQEAVYRCKSLDEAKRNTKFTELKRMFPETLFGGKK
eukprot:snap_masked-scaffold_5-processed-gene-4.16-mRNA-1 protein AED:1.00 eAED:1.00 QI:0/-1/0/0/-1/1/1/0/424